MTLTVLKTEISAGSKIGIIKGSTHTLVSSDRARVVNI